jgi:hypothetical protein
MNMLHEAGLWEKLAEMAHLAEPGTPDGDRILMFFGRSILPQMLPKETIVEERVVELSHKTEGELLRMLKDMRQERITGGDSDPGSSQDG